MKQTKRLLLSASLFTLVACGSSEKKDDAQPTAESQAAAAKPAAPTSDEARAFVSRVNGELKELWTASSRAAWVKNNFITDDTQALSAAADEKAMGYMASAIKQAAAFDDVDGVDEGTRRQLNLLKGGTSLPAPEDPALRKELADIASRLEAMYGKGEWCPEGKEGDKEACQDLEELSKVLRESTKEPELKAAWERWRTISPPMRPMYQRFVELGNQGAKEIGFANMKDLWRARYDMTPDELDAMVEKSWLDVKPLYDQLHCYVRGRLAKKYPNEVKTEGTIPAHVFGNMWSQSWEHIYPLVEPYKGATSLDVTKALKKKKMKAVEMVKMGENFFTSMGLTELPKSFYERSLFEKPSDRDVVCHASAWDVNLEGDVRIKMCIEGTEEDLITIHHELGHIYYYMHYYDEPVLYQDGANDGFHEAIGDAIALSVTPQYLKDRGVLNKAPKNDKAVINVQMRDALSKIAFLPFGYMIDKWRWGVFDGSIPPDQYNAGWWKLRTQYQGIHPPVERTEKDFDPGAKFHIPGNTPYLRYFLAHILQFQFHKAMCEAAGHTGPLHECSVYGSKEAGERLKAVLEMGSKKPWPDALFALTGTREMDAKALVEYFTPLHNWLKEQNKDAKCGW